MTVPQPLGSPAGNDDNLWSMFSWLGLFVGSFIVPLVIMLTKGTESSRVRTNAVEALNFSITLLILTIGGVMLIWASMLLVIVAPLFLILTFIFAFAMIITLVVFQFVVIILGSMRTYRGEDYRAPFAFRFVK